MKYRASAIGWKILAFVLAALCLAGTFVSGGAVIFCLEENIYGQGAAFQTGYTCARLSQSLAEQVAANYRSDRSFDRWDLLLEHEDLRFILIDERSGDILASYTDGLDVDVPDNLQNNKYLYDYNFNFSLAEEGELFEGLYVKDYYPTATYWNENTQQWLPMSNTQMLLLLPQTLGTDPESTLWQAWRQYMTVRSYRQEALIGLCAFAALYVLVLIFLLCQAGHKPGLESIYSGWLEKIPLEILLALGVGAVALCCSAVDEVFWTVRQQVIGTMEDVLYLVFMGAVCVVCGLVLTVILCSCAARLKAGRWWRQTLIFGIGWGLWKLLSAMGTVPAATVGLLVLAVVEFFLLVFAHIGGFGVILFVLFNLLVLAGGIFLAAQFHALRKAARRMAEGDLDYGVDVNRLVGGFKAHGRDLNDIARGMNKAVEQRMKSERLKTELITNVSHDIKTPLTSIVNYVDLLQKPHTVEEQAQYLEVLDRQAQRLKRLTENLVEASKASTGSIPVELTPVNLTELLNQAAAEYRQRMDKAELDLVLSQKEDLTVRADGKLLWRVLDNLLGNAVKYALPGTRVYLTADRRGDCAAIAVKNISREELNVDADELMERFVRGDSSRHTDGSGLGLNIARSLTNLQQGDFSLTVDGDLFKAELRLPLES